MSTVLLVSLGLLVLGIQARILYRARRAVRSWAGEWGYRIVTLTFESAFDRRYRDGGKTADLVYRVTVESDSGERHTGMALLWNPLFGRCEIVVRWDGARDPERSRDRRQ